MRVGRRLGQVKLPYRKQRPVILPPNHELMKLIIRSEHLRSLHVGLLPGGRNFLSPLWYHQRAKDNMIYQPQLRHLLTHSIQALPQIMGQLPSDRLNAGQIFDHVVVDYAGQILTKSSPIRKPTITKCYIAVFGLFLHQSSTLGNSDEHTNHGIHCNPVPFCCLVGQPFHYSESSWN